MKRDEFMNLFLGYMIKKAKDWLPEESTEEDMLNIVQNRLLEHNRDIKEVLKINE